MSERKWTKETQLKVMGCAEEDLEPGIEWHSIGCRGNIHYGKLFYAMSILSDAQEVLNMGNGSKNSMETNRQFINRAKYLVSSVMEDIRIAHVDTKEKEIV